MATPLNGSLIKAFEILDLVSEQRPELTAAGVAAALEMSHATAHRFLVTLEEVGVLVLIRRGTYGLGHQMIQLGRIAEVTNPLVAAVQPVIDRLSEELNESVMVGRLSRDGVVCLATAIAPRPITVNIQVGRVLTLHRSAQGKLWLAAMGAARREAWFRAIMADPSHPRPDFERLRAEIEQARIEGLARNHGESEPDIAAVAVPVHDPAGNLSLTVSAFGMASRFDPPQVSAIAATLKQAAAVLTGMMFRSRG